jgi:hypothetical protein
MHDVTAEATAAKRGRLATAVAPWWHTALLVALLLGGSAMTAHQAHHAGLAEHHVARYGVGIAAEWVLLLLVWWGLRMQRVPLADLLGFRRGGHALAEDVGAAAIFWVMAMVVLAAIGVVLKLLHVATPQKTIAALAPRSGLEMLLWIVLSLSAGFCEETVFRGYLLRQFASPMGRLWLGVLCSSLLFGVSHGYEGAAGMIAITAYGALFCVLAIVRDSLRPGMIAHAWHDIFTGVALIALRHLHRM